MREIAWHRKLCPWQCRSCLRAGAPMRCLRGSAAQKLREGHWQPVRHGKCWRAYGTVCVDGIRQLPLAECLELKGGCATALFRG
jgi:hypothetical protein